MASKALLRRSVTWAARLETGEQSARRIAALFSETWPGEVAVALHEQDARRWAVAIYFLAAPDKKAVRALAAIAGGPPAAKTLRFEPVAGKDWVSEGLAGPQAVAAGRFVVHGAHDRSRIPINRIGIEIEAALAFGTGHHGTTRGCLLALDRICKARSKRRPSVLPFLSKGEVDLSKARIGWGSVRRALIPTRLAYARHPPPFRGRNFIWRILDLGTGSGVLAIAAARATRQRVLATDIDASAVRVARDNARLNGVGAWVEVLQANGVTARRVHTLAPFDLILANIVLRPLQRFAAPLCKLAAPGARVVLSGLLAGQANAAIAAYRNLALERRIELDGWTTLVFVRRSRSRASVARRRFAS